MMPLGPASTFSTLARRHKRLDGDHVEKPVDLRRQRAEAVAQIGAGGIHILVRGEVDNSR